MNECFDPEEFAGEAREVTEADSPEPGPPAAGRRRLMLLVVLAIALAGGGVFARQWWTVGRFIETTEDAYVKADIAQISAQVGGRVGALAVTANQRVAAGGVLLRIEPSDYEAAVAAAEARLAKAKAARAAHERQITLQQSQITAASADLDSARATLDFARTDYERYRSLGAGDGGTVPERQVQAARRDFEAAKAAVAKAGAALEGARGQLAVLDSQRALRAAEVAEAEAALQTAKLNLDHTAIRARRAGTIANIGVREGEVIAPGQALFSLVPLSDIYVNANFKETQIADFRPGMAATIRSDMLGGREFKGRIDSISPAAGQEFALLPPQNATGNFTKITQRVTVRIALDEAPADKALALRPGTSVIAEVNTKSAATGQ